MKLLVLTQKIDINDDVLGFAHGWIAELAKQSEKVTAIALGAGEYQLPDNVEVLSLGKERLLVSRNFIYRWGFRFPRKIKYLFNFYRYIWRKRKNYDAVFVHMNPEYVILGGLIWRIMGKKIGLWYAHGYPALSLKIAEKLVNIIFTSTASGCRLKSRKIRIVGQGIDIDKFKSQSANGRIKFKIADKFKIISVGRISPSKDYGTLIKAVEILTQNGLRLEVEIIGGVGAPGQEKYLTDLKSIVEEKGLGKVINFIGPVPNRRIVDFLNGADLFVNMGQTGSLDKAVIEAMACELPILTCNEALEEVLGEYKEKLMYPKKDFKSLAEKIGFIYNLPLEQYRVLGLNLRKIVAEKHSLSNLINKILILYK